MPRNKSEALPTCAEAHAYADAAEAWLRADNGKGLPLHYWTDIPGRTQDEISMGAGSSNGGIQGGRRLRIAYIREHYAP